MSMFRRWRRPAENAYAERHPVDERGVPDLTTYRRPVEEYLALFLEGIAEHSFRKQVHGQWGLVAKGEVAVPILLSLLKHPDPDARGIAAGALGWIRDSSPQVEQALVGVLRDAENDEERDTALVTLGGLRSRAAIPLVAALIRDDETDGDTLHLAVETLGQIVRRRFDRRPDPLAAAREYLDRAGR